MMPRSIRFSNGALREHLQGSFATLLTTPAPSLKKEGIALTSSWPQFLTVRGLAAGQLAILLEKEGISLISIWLQFLTVKVWPQDSWDTPLKSPISTFTGSQEVEKIDPRQYRRITRRFVFVACR
jgi:hypothetical protein